MSLTLATRGSPLALWQAHTTRDRLASIADRSDVELVKVVSSGDADRVSDIARFGRIGVFTVEVDRAVLDGRAQAGVHSLKDMTTTLEDGVMLAAVLPRGPVEDVLISRSGAVLKDLPRGARVATGSMRREAMVRRARPDLEITGVRGNVDTRLAKLAAGEADALVVARAGLVRLGLSSQITEVLDTQRFLPAVGQGIVGLTCRADDDATAAVLRAIGDEDAWAAIDDSGDSKHSSSKERRARRSLKTSYPRSSYGRTGEDKCTSAGHSAHGPRRCRSRGKRTRNTPRKDASPLSYRLCQDTTSSSTS